jgi:hypothetical protein
MKAIYEGRDLKGPMEDDGLVFYTHTLCPYAQRVWLAILEKVRELKILLISFISAAAKLARRVHA